MPNTSRSLHNRLSRNWLQLLLGVLWFGFVVFATVIREGLVRDVVLAALVLLYCGWYAMSRIYNGAGNIGFARVSRQHLPLAIVVVADAAIALFGLFAVLMAISPTWLRQLP